MKTNEEIKYQFKNLIVNLDEINREVNDNQIDLQTLSEPLYDEGCKLSHYHLFFEQLLTYSKIVIKMRDLAFSMLSLQKEVEHKLAFILKLGTDYKNAEEHKMQLAHIAVNCETIAGELFGHGGEVDEIMLYLMRHYLEDANALRLVNHCFEIMRGLREFCTPWINYHKGKETDPLTVALQTLDQVSVYGSVLRASP